MINFFRKIRKKLADENQFLKYSKYAIGEIVLVMVGILLALQVNNWNQSRLERAEEYNYLKRFKKDFKRDSIYLKQEMESAIREVDSLSLFLKLIHEKQNSHLEALRVVSLADWNPKNVIIQDNTFTEITSSGKFDLIKSDILKDDILNFYTVRDFTHEHLAVTTDHGFNLLMQIYTELTSFYNYDELSNFEIYKEEDWKWINDFDGEKFKLLRGTISHFKYKSELTVSYYQELSKKANNILELIAERIEELN